MPEVGDTILRAAQAVVGQMQNQQRLQQQQLQFEAQLKQAERTFNLRSQELQARERKLQLDEEEGKRKAALAPFVQRITSAQATTQEAAATPEAIAVREQTKIAELEKLMRENATSGGKGPDLDEVWRLRSKIIDDVQIRRETEASEALVNTLSEEQPAIAALVKEGRAKTVDELERQIADLNNAVTAQAALPPQLTAPLRQKIDALIQLRDQTYEATKDPLPEEQLLQAAAALQGISPDNLAGQAALGTILRLEQLNPVIITNAFGPEVGNSSAGRLQLDRATRGRDVKWFVDRLRPRTHGDNLERTLRAFSAYLTNTMSRPAAEEFYSKVEAGLDIPGQ